MIFDYMFYQIILSIWGCMPELSSDCVDMTNASSTYLGIVVGAIIGGLITWWVYYKQNQTSKKQDELLNRIADLEDIHIKTLERIEEIDKNHDETLRSILKLEEKVDDIMEGKSKNKENNNNIIYF